MSAYEKLESRFDDIYHLTHLQAIGGWDEAVMMPVGSGVARAKGLSTLQSHIHNMLIDNEVGELIEQAKEQAELTYWQKKNLILIEKKHLNATLLPTSLVKSLTEANIRCEQQWRICRAENDWKGFLPYMENSFSLLKESTQIRSQYWGLSSYDVLLDDYVPGFSQATIDPLFSELEAVLPGLITQIMDRQEKNSIILYSIVDSNLAKYLAKNSDMKKIPCFGVLGDLILSFSKLLNQKASHQPSGQYALDEDYYKRIEAIQFTMNHDDGNLVKEIKQSDVILLGVSSTSKTPTAIFLANKGLKTSNIPLITEDSIPEILKQNPKTSCVVGLNTEPERLVEIRKNRMNSLKENTNKLYTDLEQIKKEVDMAKNTFKKYKWPSIDVTRKSVEETAASIIKIYEIFKENA